MSGEWSVTGGGTGLQAEYDDMLSAARVIRSSGSALQSTTAEVAPIAVHPALAEAAALCPGEVAEIEAAILRITAGPHGLETTALTLDALALTITTGVELYQAADATLADLAEKTQDLAALGTLGGTLFLLANPQLAQALGVHIDAATIQTSLYNNPWLLDAATRMLPGTIQVTSFGISSLAGLPLVPLFGPAALSAGPITLSALTHGNWPTTDYAHAVTGLQVLLGHAGLVQDTGTFTATPTKQGRALQDGVLSTSRSDFLKTLGQREDQVAYDDPPKVEVVPVYRGGKVASYVVQIPGTDPTSGFAHGESPYDWTTDVQEMTGTGSKVRAAIVDALKQANLHGKPVMLAGHSLGGILAADMAADPQIQRELNIQSVVTYGSPIARYHIPHEVSVLSVEHRQDLVPRLEGRPNPDTSNWTTITADSPNGDGSIAAAHDHSDQGYGRTLAQLDGSPSTPARVHGSIDSWKQANRAFFGDRTPAANDDNHHIFALEYTP